MSKAKFTQCQIDYRKRNIEIAVLHLIHNVQKNNPEFKINLKIRDELKESISKVIELNFDMYEMLEELTGVLNQPESVRNEYVNHIEELLAKARGEK